MSYANNGTDTIPSSCAQAYPAEQWKCMLAQYLAYFVETPIFITQSEYDFWSI